ncbi:hypothetical protein [Roseicyclus sp.]|uniref:hypothetical protein n=1 Tax=Roseicyclus sp. TaxID=1914329 RepID=UPI001BD12FF2
MAATVFAHAAQLAKQHGAQVNVVHCRVQPNDLLPQGVPLKRLCAQGDARAGGQACQPAGRPSAGHPASSGA